MTDSATPLDAALHQAHDEIRNLRAQLQEATSRGRRMRVELQAAANALGSAYDAVQSKRYDEALLHCGGGEAAALRALEDSKGGP